ncbi:hypothetical protein C5167_010376 [Papaver somniferum]|uniref:Aminotransferase-like plant mobile domain-containing protein n=1 Tax=Papaver somniferum TaxID=3469 RepID=A0A4Y7K359_PAPSO|nr:uncharacterized protein LOC113286058 [Papaver somniferum]RZC66691.1 hypothetical protein C5167_010376 [Papaver somniferum]
MALNLGMRMLQNGKQDLLETRKVCPGDNDLCKKYFGGAKASQIYNVQVKEAILKSPNANENEELVRLLVLYLCFTVFFTKTGGSSMSCSYLALVKIIDVINNISWPHLIHKHMMHGIQKSNGDYRKIDGCAFYLLYWYADRSNQKINTRYGCTERFPRFTRWSTKMISRTIDTLNSLKFIDIKENFGCQVVNGLENNLITPLHVMSQVEKLNERIRQLQAEVDDQKQKTSVINVKLREIQKCLSEDPKEFEIVRKILEDILEQDKGQTRREQENDDSDPHREQEHHIHKQVNILKYIRNSESGSHSE